MRSLFVAVVNVSLAASCYSQSSGKAELSDADAAAVREVNQQYVDGWLKNDPELVLKVFAPDAVLIPQGSPPVKGLDAIRDFYWPKDAPHAQIVDFKITTDEVGGSADFAYARGAYSFSFQFLLKGMMIPKPNEGNYLMLFRRQPNGRWLVTHRMWASRN